MARPPQTRPAGTLVDIAGGGRLHTLVRGEPGAAPTIVFESGLAAPLQSWSWVQQALAADTRTISYERAGTAWSKPGRGARSISRLTDELDALLRALRVDGPVILVSHSFGGLVARHFADTRPDRVAGVMFVDALHPEELRRSATQRRGTAWLEQSLKLTALRSMVGLGRKNVRDGFADLPPEAARQAVERLHVSAMWRAAAAELVSWKNSSPQSTVTGRFPRDIPVGVVISGESLRNDVAHRKLQDDLLTLSSRSFAVLARESTQYGLLLEQQWAEVVIDATRKVLADYPGGRVAEGAATGEGVRDV